MPCERLEFGQCREERVSAENSKTFLLLRSIWKGYGLVTRKLPLSPEGQWLNEVTSKVFSGSEQDLEALSLILERNQKPSNQCPGKSSNLLIPVEHSSWSILVTFYCPKCPSCLRHLTHLNTQNQNTDHGDACNCAFWVFPRIYALLVASKHSGLRGTVSLLSLWLTWYCWHSNR